MTKLSKKIISSMVLVLCFSVLFMGCSKETISADKTTKVLYNLYILSDGEDSKEIGLSDEEINEVMKIQKDGIIKSIKTNFVTNGLTISEQELEEIYKAEMEAFKKLEYDVTIESEEKDKTVVKVSTTYIDLVASDTDAANRTISEAQETGKTSINDLSKLYIENLIENLKAITPSSETKEDTFEFKKEKADVNGKTKEIWIPSDVTAFGVSLGQMVTGQ